MRKQVTTFLSLSSHLTGFEKIELQATGMLETYFETIQKSLDKIVWKSLIDIGEAIESEAPTHPPEWIDDVIRVRIFGDALLAPAARNIVTLWYLGTWSQPDGTSTSYPSPQAYIEGLVWDVMHSHPPGAKQPGYRSWAKVPSSAHLYQVKQAGGEQ